MEQICLVIFNKYHGILEKLKIIVEETEKRVINENDSLFLTNVNFFSRSYLINLCTYLESYLTEIATKVFERHCNHINSFLVPEFFISASLVSWDTKKLNKNINQYKILPTKEEIEKFFDTNKISGNIKKTFNVFELLGIELKNTITDKSIKDQITAIVDKRNDIIHRNDDGTDISLSDISNYIATVDEYMLLVKKGIIESIYNQFS